MTAPARCRTCFALLAASTAAFASAALQAVPKGQQPPPSSATPGALRDARASGPARPTSSAPATTRPAGVDLRSRLVELGLPPRAQGARGTCSIFTTCAAIEFAVARHRGQALRLSPEFVNWAAGQAAGRPSDGNFFHNALAGFEKHGVCADSNMPYQPNFDPGLAPSAEALAEAARIRETSRGAIAIRWIVPWVPDRFGVNDEQFAEIQRVLASGYPVAAGSGHSRLLVGYRDDPGRPGGGVFLTEDSALNRFDEVTYEFVRTQVADVFWVEAVGPNAPADRSR